MFGRKPKILVEHIVNGVEHKKKLVDEGNRVVVKAGRGVRGDPSVYANYDQTSIVLYLSGIWPFRRLKRKLILYDDHAQCAKAGEKRPDTGRANPKGYFEQGIVKMFGASLHQVKVPTALYVCFAIVIFLVILDLLFSTGRVRIV